MGNVVLLQCFDGQPQVVSPPIPLLKAHASSTHHAHAWRTLPPHRILTPGQIITSQPPISRERLVPSFCRHHTGTTAEMLRIQANCLQSVHPQSSWRTTLYPKQPVEPLFGQNLLQSTTMSLSMEPRRVSDLMWYGTAKSRHWMAVR